MRLCYNTCDIVIVVSVSIRLRNRGTKVSLGTVLLTKKLFVLDVLEFLKQAVMMRVVFRVQEVSNVIEGDLTTNSSGKEEQKKEFKKKDDKALLIIHQCNAVSAREAWSILVRCHSGGEKVKKVRLQTLRRQYEHMEMENSDKVSEFFSRVITVANQMKTCGEKISNVMIMDRRIQPNDLVKLDDKGKPMVFVGYHSIGVYKLFDPIRRKMIISRDVIVVEDEHWDWKNNQTSMRKKKTNTVIHFLVSAEAEEGVELHNLVHVESGTEEDPDYEVYSDTRVDEEGDIIHLALLAGSEPLNVDEALSQPNWKDAMIEDTRLGLWRTIFFREKVWTSEVYAPVARRKCISSSLQDSSKKKENIRYTNLKELFMGLGKSPELGTKGLTRSSPAKVLNGALLNTVYTLRRMTVITMKEIEEFKKLMKPEFEMTDLGELNICWLVNASKECNEAKTPLETLKKLRTNEIEESVDETLYKQMIGSLRFLCNSRPDIMFGVGLLSRFMSRPKKSHMVATKRMLRYVKAIEDLGILFPRTQKAADLKLIGYSDADFDGDEDERKSMSGSTYFLNDAPVSWSSKKQTIIAQSSCESEYMARCSAHLKLKTMNCIELKIDNTSAMSLAKNPVSHGRSKHITIKYHFLRDMVNKGRVELNYCRSEFQLADIFTKCLNRERFKRLRTLIGHIAKGWSLSRCELEKNFPFSENRSCPGIIEDGGSRSKVLKQIHSVEECSPFDIFKQLVDGVSAIITQDTTVVKGQMGRFDVKTTNTISVVSGTFICVNLKIDCVRSTVRKVDNWRGRRRVIGYDYIFAVAGKEHCNTLLNYCCKLKKTLVDFIVKTLRFQKFDTMCDSFI
ncbi:hypothetical protein V8G54_020777 [Vigna mungo]|uniref:Retroviral polymerase SH3-like domain-containing protein n=1 Tax=Vigna mungo TaxID=3915 RepID=A0AAQ3NE92_VIGMU